MKKEQDQIDEIMDNFDFAKCERVMHYLPWMWRGHQVTERELRSTARDILKTVCGNAYCRCSTGGLVASNLDGVLSLMFVLESWSGDDYDDIEDSGECDGK